jgi:hypothetical protein
MKMIQDSNAIEDQQTRMLMKCLIPRATVLTFDALISKKQYYMQRIDFNREPIYQFSECIGYQIVE